MSVPLPNVYPTALKEQTPCKPPLPTTYRVSFPSPCLPRSPTNPRRIFDEAFLKGLASSIDAQGILASLLVRPKDKRYEIVLERSGFVPLRLPGRKLSRSKSAT